MLVAACMGLASLAPLQCYAAPLNASAWSNERGEHTGRVEVMAPSFQVDVTASDTPHQLTLDTGFLEADIADFSSQEEQPVAQRNPEPRVSEFSSLGVSNMAPFPLQTMVVTDAVPFGATAGAAAGMPLMVLVWLFGAGLIGMGTVGRRKSKH